MPGRGRTCQSASSAVRERRGSMTTSRAPFFFASRTKGQPWAFVTAGFAPQTTTSRLHAASWGSIPMPVPRVAATPS